MAESIILLKLSVELNTPNTSLIGPIKINPTRIAYYETDNSKKLPANLVNLGITDNFPTKITLKNSRHLGAITESFWVAENEQYLKKYLGR